MKNKGLLIGIGITSTIAVAGVLLFLAYRKKLRTQVVAETGLDNAEVDKLSIADLNSALVAKGGKYRRGGGYDTVETWKA